MWPFKSKIPEIETMTEDEYGNIDFFIRLFAVLKLKLYFNLWQKNQPFIVSLTYSYIN